MSQEQQFADGRHGGVAAAVSGLRRGAWAVAGCGGQGTPFRVSGLPGGRPLARQVGGAADAGMTPWEGRTHHHRSSRSVRAAWERRGESTPTRGRRARTSARHVTGRRSPSAVTTEAPGGRRRVLSAQQHLARRRRPQPHVAAQPSPDAGGPAARGRPLITAALVPRQAAAYPPGPNDRSTARTDVRAGTGRARRPRAGGGSVGGADPPPDAGTPVWHRSSRRAAGWSSEGRLLAEPAHRRGPGVG